MKQFILFKKKCVKLTFFFFFQFELKDMKRRQEEEERKRFEQIEAAKPKPMDV